MIVVISGGGPVGLLAHSSWASRGRKVAVIERNETPPKIPKGAKTLTQRTMEHMAAWGVEDAIPRRPRTIPKCVGLGGADA